MKQKFSPNRGSFTRTIKLLLLTLVCFIGLQKSASATHFRYGNISWTIGTDDTVIFQIQQSWRKSFYSGVVLGGTVLVGTFDFGNSSAANLNLTVTAINNSEDWFNGVATLKRKYNPGTYTATFSSCCRLSNLLNNNADANYINRTIVQVGNGNNSPISNVPPFINFNNNALNTFAIPGFDPDGDAITYSITSTANSGLVTASPAGLTLTPGGLISWTPTVAGLYAINITITDALGATSVIDFIIRVGTFVSVPPVFDYSITPVNNSSYSIQPGQSINFNVQADDTDPGSQVTLSAAGLPSGVVFTPALPTTANPVTTNFSFTATNANLGSYVVTFTATDNNNLQAFTNVFISVNTNPQFDYPPTPLMNSDFCLLTGVPYSQVLQASNLLSGVNVSISSIAGLSGTSATTTPAVPTTPAAVASTTLDWTPAPSEWGLRTVVATAIDANNLSASTNFDLLVNTSPVFTSGMPAANAPVGVLYSHALSGTDANTPFGDVLSFHLVGAPAWLTLTDNGDGTGSIQGTPGAGDIGTYTFDILLEDIYHHCGPHVEQTVTITVGGCSLTVTAPDVSACPGVPITLGGSPAGGVWSLPNPYLGPSTTYTYYYTDVNGCTGSATGTITVGQPVITNMTVTNITGISASINYQAVVGIAWYELRWRAVGSGSWTVGTNFNFTTKLLTGLTPNTNYEVQCRGYCSTTLPPGAWTNLLFTTNGLCDVPTGLNVTNISANNAKLNWNAVPGIPGPGAYYSIRYRKSSPTTPWTTTTSNVNFKTLTGLATSTAYDYQVRSTCASSNGAWSATGNFTTAASKGGASITPVEVSADAISVYPNPTQNECNVEFSSDAISIANVKLVDMSGRVVMEQQVPVEEGFNIVTLSLGNLTNGIYAIQVYNNGQLKSTSRVIKN